MEYPLIIQGGMGIGVSGWRLAKAVSVRGQLGVVSGTAIDQILARKLQLGDPEGHLQRAMNCFPDAKMVGRILERYFIPGGKPEKKPFKATPMMTLDSERFSKELTVIANFVEVFLAKEGHDHSVGINLLEKIQLPNLFALYGAMLAGVDYVIMGAGIPREIPGVLDRLADHRKASLKIFVEDASAEDDYCVNFDPSAFLENKLPSLKRPKFISIVSSDTLASVMAKKATGKVDGFIVETPVAGGHNAPPRGRLALNDKGEPIYGQRDEVDLAKINALGLPFWLAGAWCSPEKLNKALSLGAQGIQAGTAFAFSEESGFSEAVKIKVKQGIIQGIATVFTDAKASPTGFPFKVLSVDGSLSESVEYMQRKRTCDLGYLRQPYRKHDGTIGYRCPAEAIDAYLKKGGKLEKIEGKKCLCNALMANIGLGQYRKDGYLENNLITSGNDILSISQFLKKKSSYSAGDVIEWLLESEK